MRAASQVQQTAIPSNKNIQFPAEVALLHYKVITPSLPRSEDIEHDA